MKRLALVLTHRLKIVLGSGDPSMKSRIREEDS
jgi:hypothetical protein